MATSKQELGELGERLVANCCLCPRCKRANTLKRLPPNFKCADLICDFCGFLAQVKSANTTDINKLPKQILGAAWGPQLERMQAAIYFPLYIVLVDAVKAETAIYYLPADLQGPEIFRPRKPLAPSARRAGWQGFLYDLSSPTIGAVRLK